MIINYYGKDIKYSISQKELIIYDSYEIPHRHYHNILNRIKCNEIDNPIWESRSYWSLECEWAVHNLLYKLGIQRERTVDVNLDVKLSTLEKIGYGILGSLLYIWK